MLKLGRVTKVKVLFLVLVFVFHFDLFKFSAAILEKGLLPGTSRNGSLAHSTFYSEMCSGKHTLMKLTILTDLSKFVCGNFVISGKSDEISLNLLKKYE